MATSVRTGVLTASRALRKLNAYHPESRLFEALCDVERIDKILFLLDCVSIETLRRSVSISLPLLVGLTRIGPRTFHRSRRHSEAAQRRRSGQSGPLPAPVGDSHYCLEHRLHGRGSRATSAGAVRNPRRSALSHLSDTPGTPEPDRRLSLPRRKTRLDPSG
jgi:hypothetical protein